MKNIKKLATQNMDKVIKGSSFSFGCAEYNEEDIDYQEVLKRADKELYKR